jgi:hypothetical protein
MLRKVLARPLMGGRYLSAKWLNPTTKAVIIQVKIIACANNLKGLLYITSFLPRLAGFGEGG